MKYSQPVHVNQPYYLRSMTHALTNTEDTLPAKESWMVGQLVTLCESCYAANPVGSVGVVYMVDTDDPQETFVAIILESGDDCNLITESEAYEQFISLGREELAYEFISPEALMADFQRGVFTPLIQIAHRHLLNNRE